ncbi:hypothetical protein ACFFHJ_37275 [Planotetraspora thailandica]|nr:hypothetical protein [Planotetraspora thailandica]
MVLPPEGVPAIDAVRMIVSVLLAPFQVAVPALCYVRLRELKGSAEMAPGEAPYEENGSSALPVRPPARLRWPLVAAVLPGLLYGGFIVVNPLSLANVIDNAISGPDLDRSRPTAQIAFGPAGRPVIMIADGLPQLTFCGDGTCASHSTTTLEEYFDLHPAATVIADGTLVVAGWVGTGGDRMELEMFSCRPQGCAKRSVRPLRVAEKGWLHVHAAAVATPDGIAIASIAPSSDRSTASAELTLCRDVTCANPRTTRLGGTDPDSTDVNVDNRILAVTATADGRPVVAYIERVTGKVTVATCDSPTCAHPIVHPHDPSSQTYGWRYRSLRLQIAVRPDSRPVLVYNGDDHDDEDSTQILICTDTTCSGTPRRVEVRELDAIGAPGLALDPRGRLLLAGYYVGRDDLSLIMLVCEDDGCTRRTAIRLIQGLASAGHLDFAVGPDHLPHLVWFGRANTEDDNFFHMLTCPDIRCGRG